MAGTSQHQPQKPSRVLAALSGQFGQYDSPQSQTTNNLKRKLQGEIPNGESSAESSSKRRAISGQTASGRVSPVYHSEHDDHDEDSSDPEQELQRLKTLNISPGKLANRSGFGLNYDYESPIRRIDMGGADQQMRMADFVSKSIDNLSHGVTVRGAMEKLKLSDIKDLLPGLEVRLMAHQVIGVSWMLDQELISQYKGGILADDMGLGKTVQMIATMVMNMPRTNDPCKTTLIVVPAALLQQWKEEIETKSNDMFTVHIHHGPHKLRNAAAVQSKDVVITTYQTLNSDFITPSDIPSDEEAEWLLLNGGLLARTKWFRVILDEAQFIRNRNTRSSRSVAMLRAKYRWMLSGTPVTNTLADIYGLVRFGQFRPWNDWNDFNEYIAKMQHEDAPLAGMRAQEILKPLLLRRTKNSTLEGEPILKLPPKDIELVTLEFSEEERHVYDSFEKRSKIRLNKFIRQRTLVKNHAAVLVMILRLRQLCCHPNLILSQADEFENPTALVGDESDKELTRATKAMGAAWVAQVKKRFMARTLAIEFFDFADEADEPEATCPVCQDLFINDSGRVLTCQHEICFECSLELTNSAIVHDGIFGNGTEQENLRAEKEFEAAAAKGLRPCPTCKKMTDLSAAKTFKSIAFEPSDEELTKAAKARRKQKAKGDQEELSSEDEIVIDSPVHKIFTGSALDLDDSSDEDLPDVTDLLSGHKGKKETKAEPKKKKSKPTKKKIKFSKKKAPVEDDDLVDLTMDDILEPLPPSTPSKSSVKATQESPADSDSDIEFLEELSSPLKSNSSQSSKKSKQSPVPRKVSSSKAKGKQRARTPDTSDTEDESQKEKRVINADNPSAEVFATWRKGDDDLEPSTKMLGLIDLLEQWDYTGDKTICYSQWTSMLDLVEKLFSRYGIRSLRYDGKMDRNSRENALSTFKKAGGPKVILISTRCGGVGLNLVSANRIVNLDLSWNYASESQAYDRVHRLGQDKDVFVKRLVVSNTIEERMLALQDVKVGLAEAALGEGTGLKLHKLSVKQIKALFGMGPKKDEAPANGRQQTLD